MNLQVLLLSSRSIVVAVALARHVVRVDFSLAAAAAAAAVVAWPVAPGAEYGTTRACCLLPPPLVNRTADFLKVLLVHIVLVEEFGFEISVRLALLLRSQKVRCDGVHRIAQVADKVARPLRCGPRPEDLKLLLR